MLKTCAFYCSRNIKKITWLMNDIIPDHIKQNKIEFKGSFKIGGYCIKDD